MIDPFGAVTAPGDGSGRAGAGVRVALGDNGVEVPVGNGGVDGRAGPTVPGGANVLPGSLGSAIP